MENTTKGYIYILTNPSFPEYVKIGYAANVQQRLDELNSSTAVPFAFRVYATYEVESALSDKKIHSILDKLDPELRSVENVNGKKRVREFYAMTPEDAYQILEAIAEINNYTDRLKKWKATAEEKAEADLAEEVKEEHRERMTTFAFSSCGIQVGEEIEFWPTAKCSSGKMFKVINDKHVDYEGKPYSLSALAQKLLDTNHSIAGPRYFKYKGQWLNELRKD